MSQSTPKFPCAICYSRCDPVARVVAKSLRKELGSHDVSLHVALSVAIITPTTLLDEEAIANIRNVRGPPYQLVCMCWQPTGFMEKFRDLSNVQLPAFTVIISVPSLSEAFVQTLRFIVAAASANHNTCLSREEAEQVAERLRAALCSKSTCPDSTSRRILCEMSLRALLARMVRPTTRTSSIDKGVHGQTQAAPSSASSGPRSSSAADSKEEADYDDSPVDVVIVTDADAWRHARVLAGMLQLHEMNVFLSVCEEHGLDAVLSALDTAGSCLCVVTKGFWRRQPTLLEKLVRRRATDMAHHNSSSAASGRIHIRTVYVETLSRSSTAPPPSVNPGVDALRRIITGTHSLPSPHAARPVHIGSEDEMMAVSPSSSLDQGGMGNRQASQDAVMSPSPSNSSYGTHLGQGGSQDFTMSPSSSASSLTPWAPIATTGLLGASLPDVGSAAMSPLSSYSDVHVAQAHNMARSTSEPYVRGGDRAFLDMPDPIALKCARDLLAPPVQYARVFDTFLGGVVGDKMAPIHVQQKASSIEPPEQLLNGVEFINATAQTTSKAPTAPLPSSLNSDTIDDYLCPVRRNVSFIAEVRMCAGRMATMLDHLHGLQQKAGSSAGTTGGRVLRMRECRRKATYLMAAVLERCVVGDSFAKKYDSRCWCCRWLPPPLRMMRSVSAPTLTDCDMQDLAEQKLKDLGGPAYGGVQHIRPSVVRLQPRMFGDRFVSTRCYQHNMPAGLPWSSQ